MQRMTLEVVFGGWSRPRFSCAMLSEDGSWILSSYWLALCQVSEQAGL
jgi:hypothetical protein